MPHTDTPNEPSSRRFPVALRKVPSITGWSVDTMAKILHGERFGRGSFLIENPPPILIAYEWRPELGHSMLRPQDWDIPCRMMEDLADKYKGMETREGGQDYYAVWRREALGFIHPTWYVWSDELEEAFHSYKEAYPWLDGHFDIFAWEPSHFKRFAAYL